MFNKFVICVGFSLSVMSSVASARTYSFQGPVYDEVAGPYSTDMRVNGYVETSTALLPASPVSDVAGLVVAYSFNDGVVTLDQTNSQLCAIALGTSAAGIPIDGAITIHALPGGIGAHAMNLHFGINGFSPPPFGYVETGTLLLANPICTANSYAQFTNFAVSLNGIEYVGPAISTELPTLSPWSLVLLGGLIASSASWAANRRVRNNNGDTHNLPREQPGQP